MFNTKREQTLKLAKEIERKIRKVLYAETSHLSKVLLKRIEERLNVIIQQLEVEKYQLFFNGKVGIGKSTMINYLLDFVDDEKIKEISKGKEYDIDKCMGIKTGSGRTTLVRTKLLFDGSHAKIEIIPFSEEKCRELLSNYAKILTGNETATEVELHTEYKRFLDNYFAETSKTWKEESEEKASVEEVQEILMQKYFSTPHENIFEFEMQSDMEIFRWIKEVFKKINDGKEKKISIPSEIVITLPETSKWYSLIPSYVSSITDTKGIEEIGREDIVNSMRERETLSLMCDKAEAIGADYPTLDMMKMVLTEEEKDKKYRIFYLGIGIGRTLWKIDEEGNREKGENTKKREAEDKLNAYKIHYKKENTIFISSMFGYRISNDALIKVDYSEVKREREQFWEKIERSLCEMLSDYESELLEKKKYIEDIEQIGFPKEIENTMEHIREELVNKGRPPIVRKQTEYEVLEKIKVGTFKDNHAQSLRGMINHWGEGNKINLFYNLFQYGGEIFDSEVKEVYFIPAKTIIQDSLGTMEPNLELAGVVKQFLCDQLDLIYSEGKKAWQQRYSLLARQKMYNERFWYKAYTEFGKGPGYTERVTSRFEEGYIEESIEEALKSSSPQEYWSVKITEVFQY